MPVSIPTTDSAVLESLFDQLPDVVYFVKDLSGRYVVVNQTLADRCTGGEKAGLIGRTPAEIFPPALAGSYERQDKTVLRTGKQVDRQLELHLYPGNKAGWCLTSKYALKNSRGEIAGVTGISRDLDAPGDKASGYAELAKAIQYMKTHFAEPLRIDQIAKQAGLSLYQFEQRLQRVFQMSPLQLLHQLRLDEATRLLRETTESLGDIALQTGWCDQSAFTRHFSRYTGLTPGKYRSGLVGH